MLLTGQNVGKSEKEYRLMLRLFLRKMLLRMMNCLIVQIRYLVIMVRI